MQRTSLLSGQQERPSRIERCPRQLVSSLLGASRTPWRRGWWTTHFPAILWGQRWYAKSLESGLDSFPSTRESWIYSRQSLAWLRQLSLLRTGALGSTGEDRQFSDSKIKRLSLRSPAPNIWCLWHSVPLLFSFALCCSHRFSVGGPPCHWTLMQT